MTTPNQPQPDAGAGLKKTMRDKLRLIGQRLRGNASDTPRTDAFDRSQGIFYKYGAAIAFARELERELIAATPAPHASIAALTPTGHDGGIGVDKDRLFHLFHHEGPMAQPGDTLTEWLASIDAARAPTQP